MSRCSLRAGSTYRHVISGGPPGPLVLSSERTTIEERLELEWVWGDPAGGVVYRLRGGRLIHVAEGDDAGEAPYRLEASLTEAERAQVVSFGHVRILPKPALTAAAYAALSTWGHEGPACGPCAACRNWAAQREVRYPAAVKGLLDSLGVDWRKEDEIMGCLSQGIWFYNLCFRAAGVVVVRSRDDLERITDPASVEGGISVVFVPSAPSEVSIFWPMAYLLVGEPVVELVVRDGEVPWVLAEAPPSDR